MSRSGIRTLIGVALAGYGLVVASYLPAMLPSPAPPGLVALFALQASCSMVAAVGVWRRRPWAADAVIALGVMVATTSVIEGFLLGIVPYLRVVAVVVGALALTFVVAVYVNDTPNPWVPSSSTRR
jgi:hypothetical protein